MSSSSSSPRETYEEDREYESQAKRLKTEEGEIDYSAEEGENRREATPRGDGGGGGRSFSQPVTKRGALSAVPGGSLGSRAGRRGLGPGAFRAPRCPMLLRSPRREAPALLSGAFILGPTCFPHPDREAGSGLAARPRARVVRRP